MTRLLLLCFAVSLSGNSLLQAAEHDACNKISYDWYHLTVSELRSIASDCQSDNYSSLNSRRADYLNLIFEYNSISSSIYQTRSGTESNIRARFLHMVLVEQLTPYYLDSEIQQLIFLSREYEVNNQIAEKWLRGYVDMVKRFDRLQSRK